ncbi:MAG: NAD(P)-dependent glycerol-3-phosphate dehydrogenase [Candidatus Rokubacteria bacterium]|nr:NAD(P)-dependent glycerol-3-phosphate dehydrogenase [Candidatus Rokubacteria bacterium]
MTGQLAVIGAGAWGTALSIHAARAGYAPRLWVHGPELLALLLKSRENPWYLPGVQVPQSVRPTGSLAEAAAGAEVVIVAVPSHVLRRVATDLVSCLEPGARVLSAAKGIEEERFARISEILTEVLPPRQRDRIAVLSGPTFALEVAEGRPTAAVVAAADAALARELQRALATRAFRLYTQTDVAGVELGGALKNVMAIAAGIADGLDLGANARAALLTRGLAEMARLGVARGAHARTFAGLAGLGDLLLTCTGQLSRNRRLGLALAGGTSLAEWQAGTRSVAEGVRTTRAALALGRTVGVATPIAAEVGAVLFDGRSPREALTSLLSREVRPEEEPGDLIGASGGASPG